MVQSAIAPLDQQEWAGVFPVLFFQTVVGAQVAGRSIRAVIGPWGLSDDWPKSWLCPESSLKVGYFPGEALIWPPWSFWGQRVLLVLALVADWRLLIGGVSEVGFVLDDFQTQFETVSKNFPGQLLPPKQEMLGAKL